MGRSITTAGILLAAAWCTGCMSSGPLFDNPLAVTSRPPCEIHNPVYLPQGPRDYGRVFEMVSDVVFAEGFEIDYANRYEGRIVTYPRIAPGVGQLLKPGSPSLRERLLATLQSIRLRSEVHVQLAKDGGYLVDVKVFKEVEDLPAPVQSSAGPAAFRNDPSLQRVDDVIVGDVISLHWVPLGRDVPLEQAILERIQCWDQPPARK